MVSHTCCEGNSCVNRLASHATRIFVGIVGLWCSGLLLVVTTNTWPQLSAPFAQKKKNQVKVYRELKLLIHLEIRK